MKRHKMWVGVWFSNCNRGPEWPFFHVNVVHVSSHRPANFILFVFLSVDYIACQNYFTNPLDFRCYNATTHSIVPRPSSLFEGQNGFQFWDYWYRPVSRQEPHPYRQKKKRALNLVIFLLICSSISGQRRAIPHHKSPWYDW